jgi:hypothetical protein
MPLEEGGRALILETTHSLGIILHFIFFFPMTSTFLMYKIGPCVIDLIKWSLCKIIFKRLPNVKLCKEQ